MKEITVLILAVVMAALGIGCVATGQSGSLTQAQLPPPPTDLPPLPKDWQKQFESNDLMKIRFRDPDSVKFTYVGEPFLCQFGTRGSKDFMPGYCGYAFVNAKNSFGGYTGNQAAVYYFHTINNAKTGNKTKVVMPILRVGEREVSMVLTNPDLRPDKI